MWSDKYYYLNIFHDEELSVHCNTKELIHFLKTMPELKQTGDFTFSNNSRFPLSINFTLLYARHLTSWSDRYESRKNKPNSHSMHKRQSAEL